jgi:Terminase RNAseH like domain
MAYQPFPAQKRAHKAFLIDDYKLGLLYWSRRTGKTLWSMQQIMWSAMLNQGPHYIVFKEYLQAETVAWNQYIHHIPKALIKDVNKSTLTVTFHYFTGQVAFPWGVQELVPDYDRPPASLRLLGSDKADSHRGNEAIGMIFDEYQDQDPEPWFSVYSKFFATTSNKRGSGWACFMGTAKDKDHWNDMLDHAQRDEAWYYQKATWRDNPLISQEWVKNDRKQAELQGRLGIWLQEMELIPFTQQGAVYPTFNREIHVIEPDAVPEQGTDYIVLDFGFAEGHPLAMGFVRITRDDVWYQWDEIHGTGIQLEEALSEMRYKLGNRKLTAIIADSARPDLIDYIASKGYPVVPSPKKQNSILSGIDLLRKRIKPKIQLIGKPEPNYFVASNCKKTIFEWTHYRYKELKENRSPSELPDKKNDDMLDALRYLELFFKFGHPKNDKLPEASMLKDLNGYGLL